MTHTTDEPILLCHADDVFDLASDAIRAIQRRLARLDLQITDSDATQIRDQLVELLSGLELELTP
jgi:hypothetical protein